MSLKLGGEEKNPKSWGNGYFRFTVNDLIKYMGFVVTATTFVLGVKALEKKVDRIDTTQHIMLRYIRTNIPTKAEIDHIYTQQGKKFEKINARLGHLDRKESDKDDNIDIPNWDYRLPADWLDAKASGDRKADQEE